MLSHSLSKTVNVNKFSVSHFHPRLPMTISALSRFFHFSPPHTQLNPTRLSRKWSYVVFPSKSPFVCLNSEENVDFAASGAEFEGGEGKSKSDNGKAIPGGDGASSESESEAKPKAKRTRRKKVQAEGEEQSPTPKAKATRTRRKKAEPSEGETAQGPAPPKTTRARRKPAETPEQEAATSTGTGPAGRTFRTDGGKDAGELTESEGEEEIPRSPPPDVGAAEVALPSEWEVRVAHVEAVMARARAQDPEGAEVALRDLEAIGLSPAGRAFHGLSLAYSLRGDLSGASDVLQRILYRQIVPEHHTLLALIACCGDHRQVATGEAILGLMEDLQMNPNVAWCTLIEHLWEAGELSAANELYLRGMRGAPEGPFYATSALTWRLLEGNAERGDLASCREILVVMQERGGKPDIHYFNCLLRAQCVLGQYPLLVNLHKKLLHADFEGLRAEREAMRPNVETYNILLEAFARDTKFFGDDFSLFISDMLDEHRRIQPNTKTFALLTQICVRSLDHWESGMVFLRALRQRPSWLALFSSLPHCPGAHPLQQLIRLLCMTRQIDDLALVLEEMEREHILLPAGCLRVDPKSRRTLVTNWLEPMEGEPDYGGPIDFIQRWNDEKGPNALPSSEPYVWVSSKRDFEGFWEHGALGNVPNLSYKTHKLDKWDDFFRRAYYLFLVEPSSQDPLFSSLPQKAVISLFHFAFELSEVHRAKISPFKGPTVMRRGMRGITPPDSTHFISREASLSRVGREANRPASLMLVGELKEELASYGFKGEGKRPDLVEKVSMFRAKGRVGKGGGESEEDDLEVINKEAVDENLKILSKLTLRNMYRGIHEAYNDLINSDLPSVKVLLDAFDKEWEIAKEELGAEPKEQKEGEVGEVAVQSLESTAGESGEGLSSGEKKKSGIAVRKSGGGDEQSVDSLGGVEFDEVLDADEFEKRVIMTLNAKDKKALKHVLQWEKQMTEQYGRPFLFSLDETKPLKEQILMDIGDEDTDLVTAWHLTAEREFRSRMPEPYTVEGEMVLALRVFQGIRALGAKPTLADTVFLIRRALTVNYLDALKPLVEASFELGYSLHPNLCQDIVAACYLNFFEKDGKYIAAFMESREMVGLGVLPTEESLRDDGNGGLQQVNNYAHNRDWN